ncbi:MAG: ABC transporter permease subunit, partial [Candidatus Limnocylindrales bacterium]
MDLISQGFDWLTDPTHWTGSEAIPTRVQEHLFLSGAPVLAALLVAMPLGLVIGHTRRGEFLVVTIANVGRSLPSFALLVMIFPLVLALGGGLGFWPTFVPLVLLAIPPILTNTSVAIREVDADMV